MEEGKNMLGDRVTGRDPARRPPSQNGRQAFSSFRSFVHNFVREISQFASQTRLGRSLRRYFGGRGPIFAAGISYTALFSLTAAFTVGWTTFSMILGNHPVLRDSVIEAANTMLPGLFKTVEEPSGLVDPEAVISETGSSTAGIIALLVAIYTASTVVFYLARSIRSMFGLGKIVLSWWHNIFHRVLGLFTLLMGLLVTAALIAINTVLHTAVDNEFDLTRHQWVLHLFSVGTVVLPFIVDFFIFVIMVRWVAAVRPPRRDFIAGALIAATGSTILRLLGTSVITGVSGPLLRAATTLITLIVWVNLLAAIALVACAWTANPPRYNPTKAGAYEHAKEVPNYVTMSAPHTLKWRDAAPEFAPPLADSISPLLWGLRGDNLPSKARGQTGDDHKRAP